MFCFAFVVSLWSDQSGIYFKRVKKKEKRDIIFFSYFDSIRIGGWCAQCGSQKKKEIGRANKRRTSRRRIGYPLHRCLAVNVMADMEHDGASAASKDIFCVCAFCVYLSVHIRSNFLSSAPSVCWCAPSSSSFFLFLLSTSSCVSQTVYV